MHLSDLLVDVIEQTVREKLPEDFQTAEFLLDHGQLDAVVHRDDMRESLRKILEVHQGGKWLYGRARI